MFRVNSAEYSKMIDEYKNLETVLEEEREKLQMVVESSRQTMSGEAVCTWQTGYQQTLDTGTYDEVIKQVQGLCTSMEDMKPLLNRMMEEGELLGEQLQSDALLYPSGNRVYMGQDDILLLNETYARQIHAECEDIQDTGESMRQTMEEVFDLCQDIVSLSYEKGQLDTACKRLKRLDNLQTAFSRYVRGVRDLDESLACLFKVFVDADAAYVGSRISGELIQAENAQEINKMEVILQKSPLDWTGEDCALVAQNWEKAVEEGDIEAMEKLLGACVEEGSGRFDYEVLGEMARDCKGEVAAGILTRLLANKLPEWKYADCMAEIREEDGILTVYVMQDVLLEDDNTVTVTAELNSGKIEGRRDIISLHRTYPEEYYEIAAGLLEKDAEGICKFEELLKKEAGDVSETDKTVVALLYEDKCRVIETAPDRTVREMQFDVVEKMVEGLFRYQISAENGKNIANPYVSESWRTAFAESIRDQQSMAYMMLAELQAFKPEEVPGWWNVEKKNPVVHASINPQIIGFTLQLDFVPVDIGSAPNSETLYFIGGGRVDHHVETLDEGVLEHLTELGYTKQQIIEMYLLSENVSDEGFIDHILKAEYKEAFLADPNELSNDICYLLPQHSAKLYWMTDSNGFCRELEDFINSMLYQDENVNLGYYHVDDYVNIMYTMSAKWRDARVCESYLGMIDREKAKGAVTMDVFWMALHNQYTEKGITLSADSSNPAFYNEGRSMLQLKDLIIDEDNCMYFNLMLCDSKALNEGLENIYNQRELTIDPVRNPESVSLHKTSAEIKNLQEELYGLWAETVIDLGISGLDTLSLSSGKAIRAALALFEGDWKNAMKQGLNSDTLKDSNIAKANPYLNPIWSIFEYNRKKDAICKQIEDDEEGELISWFYSADTYQVSYCSNIDGKKIEETIYLSESVSDYDVLQAIRQWDEEGFAGIIQKTYPNVSTETIGNELIKKINMDNRSEEEEAVYTFIIYGKNGNTEYENILDIEYEQFSDCMTLIDEYVQKIDFQKAVGTSDQRMTGVKTYWYSTF